MFLDVWGGCSKATGQNEGGLADCALHSAAPPQVAPRAGLQIKVLAKYLQAQVAQLQKPRPRSPDYPLSISPPGHAHSAGPTQNLRRSSGGRSFVRFFSIFWPSKTEFKICFEKISKKMRKSMILASQNGLKMRLFSHIFDKRRFLKNSAPVEARAQFSRF